jgi:hypothetical protein
MTESRRLRLFSFLPEASMTTTRPEYAADIFKGLPRRMQVGAFVFRVLLESSEHELLAEAFGRCDTDNRRIYVRQDMDAELALNTVVHELSHAVNWVYGVNDDSTEEQFTGQHTNGLIDLWMRNPRLVLWITKTLRRAKKEAHAD